MGSLTHKIILVTVVALQLLISVPTSSAEEILIVPEHYPSADQYVESIPTSRGPGATRVGKDETTPLPPAIRNQLVGDTGAKLERIATSARLGAPQRDLPDARADSPSLPSAAVSAADEGEGNRLLWLLLGLLLVTGVVAGNAGYRQYKTRRAAGGD